MAVYIRIPNPQTPDEIAAAKIAYLQTVIPGWVPNAGNLDTILIEADARGEAELWQLVSTVEDDIFLGFGPLVGVTPTAASKAIGASTWTMQDTAGYTIPAGTQVGIRTAGDTLVPFLTVADVTVPPGSSATAAGEVLIVAVDAGSAGSGLGGVSAPLELIDPLAYVTGAALTGITTGGVDAETVDDYMDRLRTELQLLTPRPILPDDFATLARTVAGVDRALAIDGYNPGDDSYGNERMVTVALQDANGQPLSSLVKTEVDNLLQGEREVNFVVWEIDPTYTTVDVTAAFTVYGGYSPAEVAARAVAAVTSYLSPGNWGRPRVGDQHTWLDVTVVRYLEVAQVVNDTEGVDYITSLLIGAQAHKNYTVAASTDVFTSTGHGYANGDQLLVTAATAGAPIALDGVYYVRDTATNTFKLALTLGGAAIDITSDGSGTVQKVAAGDVALTGVAPLPEPGVIVASGS